MTTPEPTVNVGRFLPNLDLLLCPRVHRGQVVGIVVDTLDHALARGVVEELWVDGPTPQAPIPTSNQDGNVIRCVLGALQRRELVEQACGSVSGDSIGKGTQREDGAVDEPRVDGHTHVPQHGRCPWMEIVKVGERCVVKPKMLDLSQILRADVAVLEAAIRSVKIVAAVPQV